MSQPLDHSSDSIASSELSHDQRLLMQMAYERFLAAAEWPTLRELQWELDRADERDIDVAEVVSQIPKELGHEFMDHEERLAVTVTGLFHCRLGNSDLAVFLRILGLCVHRYLTEPHPQIRNDDLAGLALEEGVARRRAFRLFYNEYLFLGSGHSNDDEWEYEVTERIRYFRRVRSIEEYVERRQWYVLTAPPRRRARPFPGSPPLPVSDSASLSEEDFSFMRSDRLRAMVERDYEEIALLPPGSKAQMVVAGGVAEALLLDALLGDELDPEDPRLRLGLHALTEEAVATGAIGRRTALAVQALRDFRNLGHPGAELRDGLIRPAEGPMAVNLVRLLIDELRLARSAPRQS